MALGPAQNRPRNRKVANFTNSYQYQLFPTFTCMWRISSRGHCRVQPIYTVWSRPQLWNRSGRTQSFIQYPVKPPVQVSPQTRWASFFQDEKPTTIYALSTASGRAAIAIIRVSGPDCISIYKALCPNRNLPKPRFAALRTLYEPGKPVSTNNILDSGALVFHFPAPNTVTGEDVLELHVHGSPAVIKSILSAIPKCASSGGVPLASIRYAEPGEFTRRAFLNDRLDLPQIEALGNTLAADTEQQRRLAIRGTNDTLSTRYEQWRKQLLYARGELEALIDFSEDQHFDESVEDFISSVTVQVHNLLRQINLHIKNASKGELLRNGIKVALLGAPNAGKSSLLNQIVGREAAIVSSEEGTTRDIVDVGVDLGGWLCKFGDMAGLRSKLSQNHPTGQGNVVPTAIGKVEEEGIRRAKARALESDVVVVVLSVEGPREQGLSLEPEVVSAVNGCLKLDKKVLVAINKTDMLCVEPGDHIVSNYKAQVSAIFNGLDPDLILPISCQRAQNPTGQDPGGIQSLLGALIRTFEEISTPAGLHSDGNTTGQQYDKSYWEDSLGVTHRQSSNLQICAQHLNDFLSQAHDSSITPDNAIDKTENSTVIKQVEKDIEIVTAAEHLRFAAESLAKITGRGEGGDVESVLGVVFEK
ncbi:tRNA modification GTPase mss1 [Nannizzia gypsea CBS 118893]|uniref:tRNA modification GTPase mss1 n=1 Tax=Arthroderma gypseum (strain ATCC MYA-4604 / CBS 118893) TaxID=535722 RepID=E4UZG5_ARTGP|nr:tRNA modification GTPase mss1 [Nannizzia gypsea CBS 118893]EFR03495.1 tRNA modification GTPase mss1 [Nannizzia gypsea CBS 118893]